MHKFCVCELTGRAIPGDHRDSQAVFNQVDTRCVRGRILPAVFVIGYRSASDMTHLSGQKRRTF